MLVLSSAILMERQLAWKIGARMMSGHRPVGRTIASSFLDELGPSAPNPLSGQLWETNGYQT